jgi:Ca-activated chloride channel family protein
MLRFANPWLLLLLGLIPMLVWRYLRRLRGGTGSLQFPSAGPFEGMLSSWTVRFRHVLFALQALALALCITAMARPQLGTEEEEVLTEGVDIILALDASGSMAAEDFAPRNRLFVAKAVVEKFIEGLKHDRAGLVVFAGKAFTRCPLTLDYGVLLHVVNSIEIGEIEDGTAIGNALAACLNRLRESKAKSKVIILVTDGVNNRGEVQPVDAAEIARTLGVKIYTVGIGSQGTARVPVQDPTYGRIYVDMQVEIDEASLTRIAETTGGLYYRAKDKPALEEIFDRIGRLEKTEIRARSYTRYDERFAELLAAALLLVLLTTIAGFTRFAKVP